MEPANTLLPLRDALCWSFASPESCKLPDECPKLHLQHLEQPICYKHITTELGLWGRRRRPPCAGTCGQQHPDVGAIIASVTAALERPACAGWRLHTHYRAPAAFGDPAADSMQQCDNSHYLVPAHMSEAQAAAAAQSSHATNCCIALDLAFDHLMGDGERRSLATQAALCHSVASQAEHRRHVTLAICSDLELRDAEGSSLFHIHAAGVEGWESTKWRSDAGGALPLTALCELDNLVYLSPEADDVLDTVCPDKVYVIGGLVDRTVVYGASRSRAEQLGIRCARLPLQENLPEALCGRSNYLAALNLTTVMHVLVEFTQSDQDWAGAVAKVLAAGAQRNLCGGTSCASKAEK